MRCSGLSPPPQMYFTPFCVIPAMLGMEVTGGTDTTGEVK